MRLKISAVLTAVVAMLLPGIYFAPAAQAADCSGSLSAHLAIRDPNTNNLLGSLDLYYSSSTGRNCARTNSSSLTYGKAKTMHVKLYRCAQTAPSSRCDVTAQAADGPRTYSYYAGPVSLYAPNNCIRAEGSVNWGSQAGYVSTQPAASHC
jgi:hypothetical protein